MQCPWHARSQTHARSRLSGQCLHAHARFDTLYNSGLVLAGCLGNNLVAASRPKWLSGLGWLLHNHPGCWQMRSLQADQNGFAGQHFVDNVARCWSSVVHYLWHHGAIDTAVCQSACKLLLYYHNGQPTHSAPFITGSPLLPALRVLVNTLCLCRGNERKPRRVTALSGVTIAQVAIGGWHCLALDAGGAHVGAQALPPPLAPVPLLRS